MRRLHIRVPTEKALLLERFLYDHGVTVGAWAEAGIDIILAADELPDEAHARIMLVVERARAIDAARRRR